LGDLTAHEFFHLWNVKRIRPQSLEPIDYTKENYTRALWFSEGVTTTAGNIIRMRAGLLDEARDLKGLAAEIGELQRRPAHLTQSAEESSLDAWLEKYDFYRLPNRSISYYNKGYLLGVLLDLRCARQAATRPSLRDVFLDESGTPGSDNSFPSPKACGQASSSHRPGGFQKYVAGTEEIPWDKFWWG
jgi:predicted metalloprotease with PDZ domain